MENFGRALRASSLTQLDAIESAAVSSSYKVNQEASIEHPSPPLSNEKQFDYQIAIDFGTTYTSIACVKAKGLDTEIFTIQGFPRDPTPFKVDHQVPSEIIYLQKQIEGRKKLTAFTKSIYGYEVRSSLPAYLFNDDLKGFTPVGHVTHPKLLLDSSPHLDDRRKALSVVLEKLKKLGAIQQDEDVICHLLEFYLKHTKTKLCADYGLRENDKVEITFSTPVSWSPSANAKMSACLQEAMKSASLGIDRDGYCNIFMVNEAESGATHVCTSVFHQLTWSDVFMLLDCGGGTTDIGIYVVSREEPLRVHEEVVQTEGAICGSSDLNEAFRDFVNRQVEHLREDDFSGKSVERIIESVVMPQFENTVKRSFDLRDGDNSHYVFNFTGLQEDPQNYRFYEDTLVLSFEDMEAIFMPTIKKVIELMESQINAALEKGVVLEKLILVGGLGDSPAMRTSISRALDRLRQNGIVNIELIMAPPNHGAASVARGALMRARNKEGGPRRVPRQSIGVYHHVREGSPAQHSAEVLNQKWSRSNLDGENYIFKTIRWITKAGVGELAVEHQSDWEHLHIFTKAHRNTWPVEYKLFASDTCTDDYFTLSHPKHWDETHEVGEVFFDLFPMKQYVDFYTPTNKWDGKRRYEFTARFQIRLIDKHLSFYAYWPAQGQPQVEVKGVHQPINMVSAFYPGTA